MEIDRITVAIASYQRRESLLRLVRALPAEIDRVRALGAKPRVVVVLDGSTDGSAEALRDVRAPFELEVLWQPNRGLASARNLGLAAAQGGLVLFLDDDLLPSPGLIARHYLAHRRDNSGHVLIGPCKPVGLAELTPTWLSWWSRHHAELCRSGRVERFDQVTVANASGPADLFVNVGGFDETFVAYGIEDYELGVRLLRRGILINYDDHAVAWHVHQESEFTAIARQRSIGRNSVRLVERHPELVDEVFPERTPGKVISMVASLPLWSPRSLAALSWVASRLILRHKWALCGRANLAHRIAYRASFAAGVAEAGPQYLARVLYGRTGYHDPWRDRHNSVTRPRRSDPTISR